MTPQEFLNQFGTLASNLATEWRQHVAPGVSPGLVVNTFKSPGGQRR